MTRKLIMILLPLVIYAFQQAPVIGEPWKAPKEADALVDPLAKDPKAVAKGKKIFESLCWPCHGMSGKGDGPTASALTVQPADLGSKVVQAQSNGALYWKLTNGRGEMASYEQVISREQRWAAVHYIRTLGPTTPK
ncbi:MAG TPA: cytochrome c [Flavobacteriales bacterium]|jgi:mono/diheme cytochrome c family protein|nr:cytochrome c [Flavobacteriales bacterium]MBK7618071.1 cytochrome c [Flavobacteriales bacterium]MBK8533148.1 cytochrome c [Flavobacteriales bacterium]MBK8707379.1 cytochrome c [Flavobacteriales bacterium]MBP9176734.1 cytochrome c [Flavobacteriales bacterium]